ncbi:MAG: FecR domain-containing protein [Geminicoccaceae bacterium]
MRLSSGSRKVGSLVGATFAILMLTVTGCQHAPKSGDRQVAKAWRVLERVGQARTAKVGDPASDLLRPGELIVPGTKVSSGKGALLIIQKDDVQITVGENTSLKLPTAASDSGLFLDRGWLRLRLTTAANRMLRVTTDHFDINASNTTLTLRADAHGSDLSVDSGRATLATTDGLHHATLVAGAAAKIDQSSSSDLLIRNASGRPFLKVAPLPARAAPPAGDKTAPEPKATGALPVAMQPPATPAKAKEPSFERPMPDDGTDVSEDRPAAAGSGSEETLVILPASRLKETELGEPSGPPAATTSKPSTISRSPVSVDSTQTRPAVQPAYVRPALPERRNTLSSRPTSDAVRPSADPILRRSSPALRQSSIVDPLQIDFDRLTEGLIEGL